MEKVKRALQHYYPFCPHCGNRFSLLNHHGSKELVCPKCNLTFFQNSKPTASCCIITKDNKILLTKRAITPFKGMWDVPGGFLNLGEHPKDGVRREIQEELHIRLPKKITLIGTYIDTYKDSPTEVTLNFYYMAIVSENISYTVDDDVSAAQWFLLSHIPKIAFKNGRAGVRDLKKLRAL